MMNYIEAHFENVYNYHGNKDEVKVFGKTIKNKINKISKYLKHLVNISGDSVRGLNQYYKSLLTVFTRCKKMIENVISSPTLIQPSADNIQPNDMNELIEYVFIKSNRVVNLVIQKDLNHESERKVTLVLHLSV